MKKRNNKKIGGYGNFSRNCGENKIECPENSINFGLCVNKNKPELCNSFDYDYNNVDEVSLPNLCVNDVVEYNQNVIRGKEKRYSPDNFIKPCVNIHEDNKITVIENETGDDIPNNFSIITLNAMGIYRGKDPVDTSEDGTYIGDNPILILMSLRAKIVREFLKKEQPDIICFQEMSEHFFKFLYKDGLDTIYPHYYEKNITEGMMKRDESKDIDVFILSKYNPKKISIYALTGNLDYTDSLGVFEFNNLIVIDVYLQAGSKASPGQKYFWKDFSRCRSQQLGFIKNLIQTYIETKGVIVLGDFNFDINSIGTDDAVNWPESTILQSLNMMDSWLEANNNPQKLSPEWEMGLTENTKTNTLRFNSKLEEKMYRYDAIFYNNKLRVMDSQVILNKGMPLTEIKDIQSYEEIIIPNSIKKNSNLMSKIIKNDKGTYDLFASDHFGVMSVFSFNSGGKKVTKKRKTTRKKTHKKYKNKSKKIYRKIYKR